MSYAEPADSGKRLIGFALVVVFHVVLIYALVNGLARKIVEVIKPPLQAKLIEDMKAPPPDKPPPPPPPKLATPPPPFIPPPEVVIQVPVAAQAAAISATTDVKPATEVVRPAVARTAAVIDPGTACAKPEFPPAALRAQQEGVVTLKFLIEVDGRVLESKIERSSGYRILDEAARRALGRCKFRPATAGGQPEQSWARIEYEWRIE
jgi:protein TonB